MQAGQDIKNSNNNNDKLAEVLFVAGKFGGWPAATDIHDHVHSSLLTVWSLNQLSVVS